MDSFQYRFESGIKSFALDDDNCYCQTTLEMGYAMCGCTDGAGTGLLGVDSLNGDGCSAPSSGNALVLYFRRSQ